MIIETETLTHLADAWNVLDEARNCNKNEAAADNIDQAMREVSQAIKWLIVGANVPLPKRDDECPECGGMVPRVVACGVPNCPRKRVAGAGDQP